MTDLVVKDGDTVTIYADKRKMIHRINLRTTLILFPLVIVTFAYFGWLRSQLPTDVYSFLNIECRVAPWIILIFAGAMYTATWRSIQRKSKPILTISPEGLTIHTLLSQIGFLSWDDVAEIRMYDAIYRYVGIVPRAESDIYKRRGQSTRLFRFNQWFIPGYRARGRFLAPINIPQEYLPITANELMALIADARPDH